MSDSDKIVWWFMEPRDWISAGALMVAFAVYWSTQTARRRDRLLDLRRERYLELISEASKFTASIADVCWQICFADLFWRPNGRVFFHSDGVAEERKKAENELIRRDKELDDYENALRGFQGALEKVMLCADPELRVLLIELQIGVKRILGRFYTKVITPHLNLKEVPLALKEGSIASLDILMELSPVRLFMGIYLTEKEHIVSKWYSCLFCEKDPSEDEAKIRDLEQKRMATWRKMRADEEESIQISEDDKRLERTQSEERIEGASTED